MENLLIYLAALITIVGCGKKDCKDKEMYNQKIKIQRCNELAYSYGCTSLIITHRQLFDYELHGYYCQQDYISCVRHK